jgi:hypothetical protein
MLVRMENPTHETSPHYDDKENMKGEKKEPYLPPPTLPASLQGVAKQGKSRSGNRPLSHRGPGALPKNRGTGFEGMHSAFICIMDVY